MTISLIRPVVAKGALVTMRPNSPEIPPQVIFFQYNPASMTRSLTALEAGTKLRAQHPDAPPDETISLDVQLAADELTDAIETGIRPPGLHADLAALELLLYPSTQTVLKLYAQGKAPVMAPRETLTLLIWGPRRVIPVRVTSVAITEQEFDHLLNPVVAEVKLGLKVVSYRDLNMANPADALSFGRHFTMEQWARFANRTGPVAAAGLIPKI